MDVFVQGGISKRYSYSRKIKLTVIFITDESKDLVQKYMGTSIHPGLTKRKLIKVKHENANIDQILMILALKMAPLMDSKEGKRGGSAHLGAYKKIIK